MSDNKRERLAFEKPEIKEYVICGVDHMQWSMEGITKVKYIKKAPTGEIRTNKEGKEFKVFEDRIFDIWVDNPNKMDFNGMKIRFITEISAE